MGFPRFRKQIDMSVYYKEVLGGDGSQKIVLNDILVKARVLSNVYDDDPRAHAYNEGKRALALEIMAMLNVDIEEAEKRIKDWSDHDQKYK